MHHDDAHDDDDDDHGVDEDDWYCGSPLVRVKCFHCCFYDHCVVSVIPVVLASPMLYL